MLTVVAFAVPHWSVEAWPAVMVDGLAMKNCTCAWSAAVVVTRTYAEPVPPRLSFTVSSKV